MTAAPAGGAGAGGDAREWWVLEREEWFGRSLIWHINRRYYAGKGADAWRQGEIPQLVTTNAAFAQRYAEVAFALLLDRERQRGAVGPPPEPLTIVELGAGSGRFAYAFVRRLRDRCRDAGMPEPPFRYVLTDAAEANVEWWQSHPMLGDLATEGIVDLALFDIQSSETATTVVSRRRIGPGSLREPLVVIANYVFDSVPQELYYVDGDTVERGQISLAVDADPDGLTDRELVDRLVWQYGRAPAGGGQPADTALPDLLQCYRGVVRDTYVLLPTVAVRCLERLAAWSAAGAVLLAADKGSHRLGDLDGMPAPGLIRHDACLSFNVNFHAIAHYVERRGGLALFPDLVHRNVDVGCCLLVDDPAGYPATRRAVERELLAFGPDDFVEVAEFGWRQASELPAEAVIAHLRFSGHDSQVLGRLLPRLIELAPEMDDGLRAMVIQAVDLAWERYFPLGEAFDLAFDLGRLLFALADYQRAEDYFGHSLRLYGHDDATVGNIEFCRAARAARP